MNYIIFHIVFVILVFNACDNVPEMQSGPDREVRYVIFSSYNPDCYSTDCAATFKIENPKILKDTQNAIAHQQFPYEGRYVFFSASEQMVENFLKNIPEKLINQPDNRIGDCNNCEKIYLEIGFADYVRYWVISSKDDEQPKYVENLVNQVQNTIAQLQNY